MTWKNLKTHSSLLSCPFKERTAGEPRLGAVSSLAQWWGCSAPPGAERRALRDAETLAMSVRRLRLKETENVASCFSTQLPERRFQVPVFSSEVYSFSTFLFVQVLKKLGCRCKRNNVLAFQGRDRI